MAGARAMQDLEVHHYLFGSLNLGDSVECAYPALNNQHPRHSAHFVKGYSTVFMRMVPECARGMADWNVDGHLVGSTRLHGSKYVVGVAQGGHFQAMRMKVDRKRRVRKGSCPRYRRIRREVLDYADIQRVSWIQYECGSWNRSLE